MNHQALFEMPAAASACSCSCCAGQARLEGEQALELDAGQAGATQTVGGFPQYQNTIAALSPAERAKINLIARQIVGSFQPGRRPIRTVRLVGHADRDLRRGPAFERRISGERALAVQKGLIAAIKSPRIVGQITWQRIAAGAAQLVVPNPRSEAERRRNRRVDVALHTPALEIIAPVAGTLTAAGRARNQSVRLGIIAAPTIDVGAMTTFAISADRRMPTINVTARIVGVEPDPTATTPFDWVAQLQLNAQTCSSGPQRVISHPNINQVVIGGQFTPAFSLIRGGELTLIARANVNGQTIETRKAGIQIVGTNPQRADIQNALPHDTLRRIAMQESGQRQFDAAPNGGTGCPLFSRDRLGGVGIFQITNPPPSDDEIWDWRSNIARGIAIFQQKLAAARGYPARVRGSAGFRQLVERFNQSRRQQGLPALRIILPNFTSGNFDTNLLQLELDTIRGFNGFAGQDTVGLRELHEFRVALNPDGGLQVANIDTTANTGEAVWERVLPALRPRQGDPGYVQRVLRQPARPS
jgi:outer membrane protein OmpA-like peptidoglycan-associated protein